jgi:hypothetical protein
MGRMHPPLIFLASSGLFQLATAASGATALSDYPLQVTVLLFGVIAVAVLAELAVDYLKHNINDAFQPILESVINEVMILGVISIVLFLLEDNGAWTNAKIEGEPVDVGVVHFVHMALFLVALLYIFANVVIIVLMKRTANRWASYEVFCLEDERSMASSDTLLSQPDCGPISSAHRDMIIDMDTRLKVYKDWRASASFCDVMKNLGKVAEGRELKRAVQFRHNRSFFLSQGRRKHSMADIEDVLHNRFLFSNFLYRCVVHDLTKCSSIGIKVIILFYCQ